jgi:hypothetical protein
MGQFCDNNVPKNLCVMDILVVDKCQRFMDLWWKLQQTSNVWFQNLLQSYFIDFVIILGAAEPRSAQKPT